MNLQKENEYGIIQLESKKKWWTISKDRSNIQIEPFTQQQRSMESKKKWCRHKKKISIYKKVIKNTGQNIRTKFFLAANNFVMYS